MQGTIRSLSAGLLAGAAGSSGLLMWAVVLSAQAAPAPVIPYQLLGSYPHDRSHFTQGLAIHDGQLYESTGRYGESAVYRRGLRDSAAPSSIRLPDDFFGEGLTVHDQQIYQLSWREHRGFVYSLALEPLAQFSYGGEGWGLADMPADDGAYLVVSDGSATLRFLQMPGFTQTKRLTVRDDGVPVEYLNELEFNGELLLANIWFSSRIALIDPDGGQVLAWVDLAPLQAQANAVSALEPGQVLNGIAYSADSDSYFVTGKCWPLMFEIRLDLRAVKNHQP